MALTYIVNGILSYMFEADTVSQKEEEEPLVQGHRQVDVLQW